MGIVKSLIANEGTSAVDRRPENFDQFRFIINRIPFV